MSLKHKFEISLIGLALSLCSGTSMAEVVTVVSSTSAISTLSQNQVVDIFLGKASHFPNGEPAVPIDQAEGSVARDEFYMRFASKSAAQIKAYWSKIIFTGKGQPPKEVPSGDKIRKLLAENPPLHCLPGP